MHTDIQIRLENKRVLPDQNHTFSHSSMLRKTCHAISSSMSDFHRLHVRQSSHRAPISCQYLPQMQPGPTHILVTVQGSNRRGKEKQKPDNNGHHSISKGSMNFKYCHDQNSRFVITFCIVCWCVMTMLSWSKLKNFVFATNY